LEEENKNRDIALFSLFSLCNLSHKAYTFIASKFWVLFMMAEKEEAMHAVLKESVDLVQKITHFSVFNFFFSI
jgi:hypothetical protein